MQAMSIQQLLQSPKASGAKGEVVSEKLSGPEGLLSNGENKISEQEGVEIDFSSLFAEAQNGAALTPSANTEVMGLQGKQEKSEKTLKIVIPENAISGKIAATSINLDQLLNSLKGTEDQAVEENVQDADAPQSLKKGFFPNTKTESENPLEFLVKNSKDKNLSATEATIENVGEKSDLSMLMDKLDNDKIAKPKSEFFPNKITTPASLEKVQNQEQTVKILSGEDFVKNLNAANPQAEAEQDIVLGKQGKLDKKQLGMFPTNIPQIKNYGKGQNILNDSMIRNTNDLAFKDIKKLKSAGADELRSPEMKVAADLAMIKESPLALLQLKASPVQENQVQVETKVLNLSNIDAKNTNEIIKTISDYVEQNQVANKSSLDLTVKHDSLGQFKIQVNKSPNQNQVDMQITTSSIEGHKFFVAHEADLMKNLQQSGVNLSDLRIVSSMKEATPFSQSESKQFSSSQHEQNGDSKQFMSFESSDFKEGSQKRKSLWDEYQERYGA